MNNVVADDNVCAVVAVGSAVRPDVPSADLDLVVICREPRNLLVGPPLEIDLRKYRADRIQEQLAAGNDLLGWAVKFGRVLYERNGYWSSLSEYWRIRLPMPRADVAARRADEALERLIKVLEIGDCDAAEEQALAYATHLARAELLSRNVYPASRPELPAQLRQVGSDEAAECLERLIDRGINHSTQISTLVETRRLTNGYSRRGPARRRRFTKRG